MSSLINPVTGRTIEQETMVMRLQFWLSSKRVFKVALERSGIPGESLAMFGVFAGQMSDTARWRFTQMLLANKFVRRSIVAYELKQGGLTRAQTKADILRLKTRADEVVKTAFLMP